MKSGYQYWPKDIGIKIGNIGYVQFCVVVSAIPGIISIISGHIGSISVGPKFWYRPIFKTCLGHSNSYIKVGIAHCLPAMSGGVLLACLVNIVHILFLSKSSTLATD